MGGTNTSSRGPAPATPACGLRSSRVAAWARHASLALAIASLPVVASSCRVSDTDVKRWESTQRGPFKLVAVVTHDKYPVELRTEAAMSLIRMPPRGGVRQGIKFLIDKYKDEEGEERSKPDASRVRRPCAGSAAARRQGHREHGHCLLAAELTSQVNANLTS